LKVRALLDRAAGRLEQNKEMPPLVEAAIRLTMGRIYTGLGELEKAEHHLRQAYELQQQHAGENAGKSSVFSLTGCPIRACLPRPTVVIGCEESGRKAGLHAPLYRPPLGASRLQVRIAPVTPHDPRGNAAGLHPARDDSSGQREERRLRDAARADAAGVVLGL